MKKAHKADSQPKLMRKGVNLMTYSKPRLNGYSAIARIQSGPNAKTSTPKETDMVRVTPAAYEADE
jgi:hypothetical protein